MNNSKVSQCSEICLRSVSDRSTSAQAMIVSILSRTVSSEPFRRGTLGIAEGGKIGSKLSYIGIESEVVCIASKTVSH